MKGLVFKEFMTMVESAFGDEILETIIEKSNLKTEGAYTSVGTYDYTEIVQLVGHLSRETGTPMSALIKKFGKYLIRVFIRGFPQFFLSSDAFSLLKSIDSIIHVEVKKLYPDAELPQFRHEEPELGVLVLYYSSTRPFADLAEGLIVGLVEHYGEKIELNAVDTSEGRGTSRQFTLKKVDIA